MIIVIIIIIIIGGGVAEEWFVRAVVLPRGYEGVYWRRSLQKKAGLFSVSWGERDFSKRPGHCGETVTIIAVTIIQDGGRRRRWVRAGPDCDICMPRMHI